MKLPFLQGIIQRILQALNWNVFNPRIVTPEYSVSGGRVDFALCHPADKPIVFIEVKQIGKIEGAERQLFEYAFHQGVPMAILTDGAEWHFFLPAEQGNYDDRRVYKLDLLEKRDRKKLLNASIDILIIKIFVMVKSIENARKDYKNVAKEREINRTLPEAMLKLINDCDELLVDLLKEKVESLCGYSPNEDIVINYLKNNLTVKEFSLPKTTIIKQTGTQQHQPTKTKIKNIDPTSITTANVIGFSIKGKEYKTKGARDFCIKGLTELSKLTDNFFARYAALPKHGKKRRFVANNKFDLYPGREDLAQNDSFEIIPGWWVGTNIGQLQAIKIVLLGCEIAKLKNDKDFKVAYMSSAYNKRPTCGRQAQCQPLRLAWTGYYFSSMMFCKRIKQTFEGNCIRLYLHKQELLTYKSDSGYPDISGFRNDRIKNNDRNIS